MSKRAMIGLLVFFPMFSAFGQEPERSDIPKNLRHRSQAAKKEKAPATPVVRPLAKPQAKPVSKPVSKPVAKPTRPTPEKPVVTKPATRPTPPPTGPVNPQGFSGPKPKQPWKSGVLRSPFQSGWGMQCPVAPGAEGGNRPKPQANPPRGAAKGKDGTVKNANPPALPPGGGGLYSGDDEPSSFLQPGADQEKPGVGPGKNNTSKREPFQGPARGSAIPSSSQFARPPAGGGRQGEGQLETGVPYLPEESLTEKRGLGAELSSIPPGMAGGGMVSSGKTEAGEKAARLVLGKMLALLGGYENFLLMKCIHCKMRITAFNDMGSAIFSYDATHDALVGREYSDLVTLHHGYVMGRHGAAPWIEIDHLERPDRSKYARDELEILGFLLRFPFVLGDRNRFRAVSTGEAKVGREDRVELIVMEQVGRREIRHRLLLEPVTLFPREIEYTNPAGRMLKVHFLVYRKWGNGILLPVNRVILSSKGDSAAMEIKVKSIWPGYPFKPGHFLPKGK